MLNRSVSYWLAILGAVLSGVSLSNGLARLLEVGFTGVFDDFFMFWRSVTAPISAFVRSIGLPDWAGDVLLAYFILVLVGLRVVMATRFKLGTLYPNGVWRVVLSEAFGIVTLRPIWSALRLYRIAKAEKREEERLMRDGTQFVEVDDGELFEMPIDDAEKQYLAGECFLRADQAMFAFRLVLIQLVAIPASIGIIFATNFYV